MTAILLALASALAFATATVVQHRAATATGMGHGLRALPGWVRQLLRHPGWLAGQGTAVLGLVLHALALRGGRVVVVAPLLSSGLVLALVLGALVDRRHPDRPLPEAREWGAAAVVAAGLAIFLVSARPAAGFAVARPVPLLGCVVGSLVVTGAALASARRVTAHRTVWLSTAAGLGFGVTGLLLKDLMGRPLAAWPTSWSLIAFVGIGGLSILMAQWAYQSGSLISSLPVMTVLEPLVVLIAAGPVFGELLAPGLLAHTGQAVGAAGLIGGVVLLARRAALRELEERESARHARAGTAAADVAATTLPRRAAP